MIASGVWWIDDRKMGGCQVEEFWKWIWKLFVFLYDTTFQFEPAI
jgi:hypothetical protein